jgi:hypothetical protein
MNMKFRIHVALLAGIGIAVALLAAHGVGRAVNSQLFGVPRADFAVLAGGAALSSPPWPAISPPCARRAWIRL